MLSVKNKLTQKHNSHLVIEDEKIFIVLSEEGASEVGHGDQKEEQFKSGEMVQKL